MSAAALLSTTAVAADGPQGSVTWKGFYIGGSIGGAWSQQDFTNTPDANWVAFNPTGAAFLAQHGSGSASATSLTGGVLAGYQWQTGNIVFGYEVDVNALDPSSRQVATHDFFATDVRFTTEGGPSWYATFRGRLGLAFDRLLVYGTGGLAVGDGSAGQSIFFAVSNSASSGSTSNIATGWVAGAGIEFALSQNWTIRGEYLHVDLGSTSVTLTNPAFPTLTNTFKSDMTFDVGRFALTYKF